MKMNRLLCNLAQHFSQQVMAWFLILLGLLPAVLAAERPVYPIDVATNKDGVIFIADLKLPGVWKLQEGKLEIVHQASKKFRTPLNAIRCLSVDDKGVVYAGDSATRNIYRFDADWKATPIFDQGPGIPSEMIILDDSLYVADLETQRVWKANKDGGELKEVAVVAGVRGLAADEQKNIFCVTTVKDPIRKLTGGSDLSVLVKGRPFQLPHQAEVIGDQIFIADNYAGAIWRCPLDGSKEPEKFVSGAPLKKPVGLGLHKDGLLVADPHAKQIFLVSKDGKVKSLISE